METILFCETGVVFIGPISWTCNRQLMIN